MTGTAERMMQVFAYLEGVIVLKLSPIIGVGDSFEHVGAESHRQRRNVGEGTGQVRDFCFDDDADEGPSSVDESQARETDGTWR